MNKENLSYVYRIKNFLKYMGKVLNYIWPVLLCIGGGFLASLLQRSAIVEWYPGLDKPSVTPPAIVFPIVWTVLYVMIGLSLSFLLNRRPSGWLIGLWGAQLALNFLWSLLFFMCRNPFWGLVDIVLLDFLVVLYIVKVYTTSAVSSWLFVPYALWLFLATYLNAYIFFNN